MANINSTAAPDAKLTEATIEQISRNLYEIGTSALAIRHLTIKVSGGYDDDGSLALGIRALAEKTGYLSDESLRLIGDKTGCVGGYAEWADVSVPQPEEASHA